MEEKMKPGYKLYSKGQVGLATFLGTPVAGTILMSKNSKALGQPEKAKKNLFTGFLVTGVLLLIGFFLPESVPSSTISLPSLAAVIFWYKSTQEPAYLNHISQGGEKGSWTDAIGTGFLCLIILFALIFGIALILPEGML